MWTNVPRIQPSVPAENFVTIPLDHLFVVVRNLSVCHNCFPSVPFKDVLIFKEKLFLNYRAFISACHSACETCIGEGSRGCTKCNAGYQMTENECKGNNTLSLSMRILGINSERKLSGSTCLNP